MKKAVLPIIVLALSSLGLSACQDRYNPTKRDLPLTDNVVPLPVLCKQIKKSDDVRSTALYNRYCAVQNIQRLVSAREAYEKVRQCYSGGSCE